MENRQLKHRANGRILPYSKELSKHPEMMLMIDGKVMGVVDKTSKGSGNKRTKTEFLYNPVNGRVFPWTDSLAKERPDLIGVDDIAEIPGHMTQPEAAKQSIHDDENEPDSYGLTDDDDKPDSDNPDESAGEQVVNLETMTKKELVEFANIEYEVELDMAMKKAEMKDAIEKLAEKAE